jgi:hypothetical protein
MEYEDLEFLVDPVVDEEVVCHTDTVWFHRVSWSVIVVTDLG